ncbi:MAG: filamentous hemagglutinin N-terminal domain-containing protein [Pseudomonadota bacterium]|nr:filamentous hemagglutinin N-terminal domain-containing protein [Pseudomonadota bacterium]
MSSRLSSRTVRRPWRMRPLALSLACIGAAAPPAWAQINPGSLAGFPAVGSVAAGTISGWGINGTAMNIDQASWRAVINWNGFSLAGGNSIAFNQAMGAGSVTLNRVTTVGNPSQIFGTITAPGHVFIVNPAGVLFGAGSQVNVGGLVASTLDIGDDAFAGGDRVNTPLAGGGALTFTRTDGVTGKITVDKGASITTTAGGTVALMGQEVNNAGQINVAQGSVGLLSGLSATLDYAGDGLTTFKVSNTAGNVAAKALVTNLGQIAADGGRVDIAAMSTDPGALVVNQQGVIQARSLESRDGRIVLTGGGANEVRVSGTLDASGTTAKVGGGTVQMSGGALRIDGATVDASGTDGGVILGVAGGVMMSPANSFKADGSTGKGGAVGLLGQTSVHADGAFSATGATDGGVVVFNGKSVEVGRGTAVSAAGASGANGKWQVQSTNDLSVTGEDIAYQPAGYVDGNATSRVGDAALGRALSRGTDVALSSKAAVIPGEPATGGAGVSFADGAQVVRTGGRATTLQVDSRTNIAMGSGSAIRSEGGALNVNFNADAQGDPLPQQQAIQTVDLAAAGEVRGGAIALQGATIESGGGDIRFYGQSNSEAGRALGVFNAPGVQIQDSRVATCAAGSDCSGVGGEISLRGEGGTTRFGDANVFSGIGVSIVGSTVETGTGALRVDGRGGMGSAGLSILAAEGGPTVLRSSTGDIGLTGSSRSWLATDPAVLVAGNPTGAAGAFGAGTGVSVLGATVATGGNVAIGGTGGDLSRIENQPALMATLANAGQGFAAGNGVVLTATDVSAGRGRTLEVSGTAGSRGYTFALDGSGNGVAIPGANDAFGIGVGATPDKSLSAEGGTVRLTGSNSDVAIFRVTADETVGPDGPSRAISTASSTGAGGTIDIRGRNIVVDGLGGATARLDSSGAGQAGTVSLRATAEADNPDSGIVAVGANALLQADALGSGNGGRIAVVGDTSVIGYGTLTARGGAGGGNGGLVETSAPTFELAGLRVDASGAGGKAGTWLVDPYDVTIVHGAAAGSLAANPFTALATSVIQDGDINAALNAGSNVTIATTQASGGTQAGDITMFNGVQINYNQTTTGERTLTLNATNSVRSDVDVTIAAAGADRKLNVVFNADAENGGLATGGGQVSYSGSIYSNGGNVTLRGAAANPAAGVSVRLNGQTIDTRGGNAQVVDAVDPARFANSGGSDAQAGGNVAITGRTVFNTAFNSYDGVVVEGTSIRSGSGNIDIFGSTDGGSGVVIQATQGVGGLFSTSGNISVTGIGGYSPSSSYSPGYGVVIGAPPFNAAGQPRISSVDGNITVRGLRQAGEGTGFGSGPGAGVQVGGNAQVTTTGRGDIEITGEMQGRGAGVAFAPTFSDTFGTQQGGIVSGGRNVVLRAANDGSADALALGAGSQASAGGVMNLRPGGLNLAGTPDAYVATAVDRTANAITVGGAAATGFAVSADELTRIAAPTLVFGSNSHAADITVAGALDTASALTLHNGGGGNIALNAPVTAPTLGLVSAGNITQTASAPITAGTLLAQSSGGSVLLDRAANNVSAATLGGSAAGAFRYQDVDALRVGNVSVVGYDAAGNLPQVVATGSMAADTVYVRTLSGDLTLATNVSSTSGTDLIAASRFQNAGAFTIAGAPWRVWADTWVGETRGGLAGSGITPNLYHCAYLGLCTVSISPGDNHFIYAQQPVATVVIGDANRFYGAPNPLFTYSITGLILGDRGLGFSGALSTTANAFSPPGFYPITGSFTSAEGYLVNVVPGSLRVSLPPSLPLPDVLREVPNTYTFDRNIGAPPICFATGPLGGDRAQQGDDLLAREWSRVRSRPNLTSCIDTERKNGCADF